MKVKKFLAGILSGVLVLTLEMQNVTLPVYAVTSSNLKENTNYVIVSKSSGKAMTVDSYDAEVDAPICQETLHNYESQIWNFELTDEGTYIIKNYKSGLVMNVPDASTEGGTQIVQYNSNGNDNQQWIITDISDGYCRISPKHSAGMALNIEGASVSDGAAIIQWGYSGANNELWEIREVSNVVTNPVIEAPDYRKAVDDYLDTFFYRQNGLGYLNNEPDNGFWTDAEIFEVFIDAYEQFGDEKYKTYMKSLYDGIISRRTNDWSWNEYNDDVMWMVIACTRAYILTGEQAYLTSAVNNFTMCYNRAWDTSFKGGGLWWRTDNTSKNACVNGPGAIAACLLGEAIGDSSYYSKAKAMIDWEYENLFNAETGAVYDNVSTSGDMSTWSSTYNQGTFIGACTMLYKYYNDEKYLNAAKITVEYSSKMGDGARGYLNREQNTADLIGFKGILGRWLGYYIKETGDTEQLDWMYRNSVAAWNNRNSDSLMWTTFGNQTPENIEVSSANELIDGTTTPKADYAAWGCSAAVAWLLGTYAASDIAEVFGVVVSSNNPGMITVVWGHDPNTYNGELYNVYVDGEKKLSNVPCASYDINDVSGGTHTVKITATLNNIESAGVSYNVDVEEKVGPKVATEINGYQISTSVEGFRVIYSISDPDLEAEEIGMIYGLSDYVSSDDMVVGSNNSIVHKYYATEAGKLDKDISSMESATSYVMTMKFVKTSEFYNSGISVRAYVRLADGSYIYSDVKSTSIYNIAGVLYNNQKMNSLIQHEYLYENILKIVNPAYNQVDYNWENSIAPSK